MKYTIRLNGSQESIDFAKKLEEDLEKGAPIKLIDDSTKLNLGKVQLIGWPVINGESCKTGNSAVLLEDSLFHAVRTWMYLNAHQRSCFMGWPKLVEA